MALNPPFQIEAYAPPIYLPLFRDIFITAWNNLIANAPSLEVKNIAVKNGLEVLTVELTDQDFLHIKDNVDTGNLQLTDIKQFEQELKAKIIYEVSGKKKVKQNISYLAGTNKKFNGMNMGSTFLNAVSRSYLYAYVRGFFNYDKRSYKLEKGSLKQGSGRFYLGISNYYGLFCFKLGYIFSKIQLGKVSKNIFLVTGDIILDKSFSRIFIKDYYNRIKTRVKNILSKLISNRKDYPLLYDFIMIRLLIEIIKDSLNTSIVFAYNWPSLRLYLGSTNGYVIIEITPTIINTAKLALFSSAEYFDLTPSELLFKLANLIDKGIGGKERYISDIYSFINSTFQGNPDIDTFYRIERANIAEQ